MIPIIGEVADGANALLYVAQGDYAMAALSAASMIPVVGNVTGAAKLGAKYADDVIAVAARWGDEAAAAGKQGDEVLGAAGRKATPQLEPVDRLGAQMMLETDHRSTGSTNITRSTRPSRTSTPEAMSSVERRVATAKRC
jgi:hypothetical protein